MFDFSCLIFETRFLFGFSPSCSPPPALPPKKRQSAPSPTRVAVVAPMSRTTSGSSLPVGINRQVTYIKTPFGNDRDRIAVVTVDLLKRAGGESAWQKSVNWPGFSSSCPFFACRILTPIATPSGDCLAVASPTEGSPLASPHTTAWASSANRMSSSLPWTVTAGSAPAIQAVKP